MSRAAAPPAILAPEHDDEPGYRGAAELIAADEVVTVQVSLAGHFDPNDGHYHWYGRVQASPDAIRLKESAPRSGEVGLRIGGGPVAPGRLSELDPWGNPRIVGTGRPPFALESLDLSRPDSR